MITELQKQPIDTQILSLDEKHIIELTKQPTNTQNN